MPGTGPIFGGTSVAVSMMLSSLQESLSELAAYETRAANTMAQAQSVMAQAGAQACVKAGEDEAQQLRMQMGTAITGAVTSGVSFTSSAYSTGKLYNANPATNLHAADSFTKTMNNGPRTQAAIIGGRQPAVLTNADAANVADVERHISNGEFASANTAISGKIYTDEQKTRIANAVKSYKDSQSDPYNSNVAMHARFNETLGRFSEFSQSAVKAAEAGVSANLVADKAQQQALQSVSQSSAQQLNQSANDMSQKKDKVFDELMQLIQGLPQAIRAATQYQG